MENKFTVSFTDDELVTVLALLQAKVKETYSLISLYSEGEATEVSKGMVEMYREFISKYDFIIDKIHLTLDFEGILINGDVPF